VSVHEVSQGGSRRVGQYVHKGPVLDVARGAEGSGVSLSCGLDMAIIRHDFQTGVSDVLGSHSAAVKCVEYNDARGLVVSGSWDKTVKVWDVRQSGSSSSSSAVATLSLPDRCYTLAISGENKVVVGTAGRHVQVYDLRLVGSGASATQSSLLQSRESSMKYQTRTIQCLPDGSGYITGSIEGRVAVDFFDMAPEVQENKYAFKVCTYLA